MPRWDDGWGYQFVPEYRFRQGVVTRGQTIDSDLTEHIGILNIDGVYTWDRSVRVTAKVPVVLYAVRESRDATGNVREETNVGLGDVTLAVPLKKYFNLDGRSGSWTLAPQFKVPTAKQEDYWVHPRAWGVGLSGGYETETYRWHGGVSLAGWYFFDQYPATFEASAQTGVNVHMLGSSGHIKVKAYLDYEENGSLRIRIGPIFYWRFTDLVHGQVKWKMDIYHWRATPKMGNEHSVTAGIGFVY